MTSARSHALRVIPLDAPLGADVEGVDLSKEINSETLATILDAWAQHLVLRFRGQRLDEDGLMALSARFWQSRSGTDQYGGNAYTRESVRAARFQYCRGRAPD